MKCRRTILDRERHTVDNITVFEVCSDGERVEYRIALVPCHLSSQAPQHSSHLTGRPGLTSSSLYLKPTVEPRSNVEDALAIVESEERMEGPGPSRRFLYRKP